eukprot:TRINITY_DN14906_c0_g1_i1.p1 TRINITY_DN14906_c0_g1~~TRINITY_DN14906_c0_g1_i1.p1  ORF type:complete len:596 (-),score=88.06 TRINITY_DN14906_c0_g1_i1:12-1799(-)
MSIHVVAIEARCYGEQSTASHQSGLALCLPEGPPLVLTTARVSGASHISVSFPGSSTSVVVEAEVVASVPIEAASNSFLPLASRGWRCGATVGTAGRDFALQLLRPTPTAMVTADFSSGLLLARHAKPLESWIGLDVQIISAPFGARSAEGPNAKVWSSMWRAITRGVISNVSSSSALLLTDSRCAEGSAGAALVLEGDGNHIVALLAPLLRSTSGEIVALNVAIALPTVIDALLANDESVGLLRPKELETLSVIHTSCTSPSASMPASIMQTRSHREIARRGVALLWLETTGSWASAIVVSEEGHLLTCAHLLTGKSWMEAEPEEQNPSETENMQKQVHRPAPPVRPSPLRCRGRCQVEGADGEFTEVAFEADVLHVCSGFLDAALLLARLPPSSRGSDRRFSPQLWQQQSMGDPREGSEVWAVGHGLFGPGTPWQGPTITRGNMSKVVRGHPARAAVLQSSAAVHRGCSGGALVDASTGKLLGMVTTNVKQQDGSVMPHVNFSLPISLVAPLQAFLEDPLRQGALQCLEAGWRECGADPQERSLWRLEPESLNLPSRMAARKQQALERMHQLTEEADKASQSPSASPPPRSAL